ncbi:MAG: 4-hydroxy-3-methylbut-2-enyl diphosphate reductase [Planctomycetota bacterium]
MPNQPPPSDSPGRLEGFRSDVVERVRAGGNIWQLPRGELRLPKVFGFCRGVERALVMLAEALAGHAVGGGRVVLLGQIIHNPWVNDYFEHQGVRILSGLEMEDLESLLRPEDAAVVPAFGVRPEVERRLQAIGCRRIDTTCGNVRRLWQWVERAAADGYGVMIFGRTRHDETIVTRSRLAEAGGSYVIVESLAQADTFCRIVTGAAGFDRDAAFREAFAGAATNAQSLTPFARLAQVSQTTMLYDDTLAVRDRLRNAFAAAFAADQAQDRLLFEPTVCRATQNRQSSAVELCRSGVDLTVVVGGFESSNTRHLYELARAFSPAVFIEHADSILSADRIRTIDPATETPVLRDGWLPKAQPLRIGVLAGASCPEIVVGQVLERLAALLG